MRRFFQNDLIVIYTLYNCQLPHYAGFRRKAFFGAPRKNDSIGSAAFQQFDSMYHTAA